MQENWNVSTRTLSLFWNRAFPIVMGKIWAGELSAEPFIKHPKAYLNLVGRALACLELPEELPVSIEFASRFDYIVSERGLELPWPAKPDLETVLLAYARGQGSSVPLRLPSESFRASSVPVFDAESLPFSFWPRGDGGSVSVPEPDGPPRAIEDVLAQRGATYRWQLLGTSLQALERVMAPIIASLWNDKEQYAAAQASDEAVIAYVQARFEAEEQGLPQGLRLAVNREAAELSLTPEHLVLPFPEQPSLKEVYRAFASGHADVPTFSNTGLTGCCFATTGCCYTD